MHPMSTATGVLPHAAGTPAVVRTAALWGTAAAAALAAGAAALVAWDAGLGQRQARIGDALVVTACCVVGALVLSARPGQPVGRTLLAGGAAWGLASLPVELLVVRLQAAPDDVRAATLMSASFTVRGLGWLLLVVVLPLVFPDGAAGVRRRWLPVAAGTLALFALMMATRPLLNDDRLPAVDNPVGLPPALTWAADLAALAVLALGTACLVAGLVGVVQEWRRGDGLRRQQVGWFALGLVMALAGAAALAVGLVAAPVFAVATAALPVTVGIAVLQHRLYEVDVLVNRTLLYALLTAAVAGVYVLVVAGVGAALDVRGAGWLPWVATAVVAVAVQPLREAIQGSVNRLTFGAWQEPQLLMRSVHDRLEQAATPDGALREVLATVRGSLRVDGLVVTGADGGVVARDGADPGADGRRFALVHAGTPVGTLAVAGGRRRRRDDATLTGLAAALAPRRRRDPAAGRPAAVARAAGRGPRGGAPGAAPRPARRPGLGARRPRLQDRRGAQPARRRRAAARAARRRAGRGGRHPPHGRGTAPGVARRARALRRAAAAGGPRGPGAAPGSRSPPTAWAPTPRPWRWRPTGSCRRRSPTCCGTPARAAARWTCGRTAARWWSPWPTTAPAARPGAVERRRRRAARHARARRGARWLVHAARRAGGGTVVRAVLPREPS